MARCIFSCSAAACSRSCAATISAACLTTGFSLIASLSDSCVSFPALRSLSSFCCLKDFDHSSNCSFVAMGSPVIVFLSPALSKKAFHSAAIFSLCALSAASTAACCSALRRAAAWALRSSRDCCFFAPSASSLSSSAPSAPSWPSGAVTAPSAPSPSSVPAPPPSGVPVVSSAAGAAAPGSFAPVVSCCAPGSSSGGVRPIASKTSFSVNSMFSSSLAFFRVALRIAAALRVRHPLARDHVKRLRLSYFLPVLKSEPVWITPFFASVC